MGIEFRKWGFFFLEIRKLSEESTCGTNTSWVRKGIFKVTVEIKKASRLGQVRITQSNLKRHWDMSSNIDFKGLINRENT